MRSTISLWEKRVRKRTPEINSQRSETIDQQQITKHRMDERKAYWFEQPYMPRMKSIAVAPVILEDERLSFCVPGDDGPPWSGVWNLTGKIVLDGDDYIYESIGHLVGWCFFRGEMEVAGCIRCRMLF